MRLCVFQRRRPKISMILILYFLQEYHNAGYVFIYLYISLGYDDDVFQVWNLV